MQWSASRRSEAATFEGDEGSDRGKTRDRGVRIHVVDSVSLQVALSHEAAFELDDGAVFSSFDLEHHLVADDVAISGPRDEGVSVCLEERVDLTVPCLLPLRRLRSVQGLLK